MARIVAVLLDRGRSLPFRVASAARAASVSVAASAAAASSARTAPRTASAPALTAVKIAGQRADGAAGAPPPSPQQLQPPQQGPGHVTSEALRDLCANNAAYFAGDASEAGARLHAAFLDMARHLDDMRDPVERILSVVHLYDYDADTPGNGFRSFLHVVQASVWHGVQLNRRVCLRRDGLLFRRASAARDAADCGELLRNVATCLRHLCTLLDWCPAGELFAGDQHSAQELLARADDINQCCFYGRSLGFQFCESMRSTLRFICLSMAIFSEAYYGRGSFLSRATSSVWTSGRYVLDPETRARRVVNISQHADIDFCKAFWFLSESELMRHLPAIVAAPVAVSKLISVPPEPLEVRAAAAGAADVRIPVPAAHVGARPLHVRLISHALRRGMVGAGGRAGAEPPSPGLLVHCHGGGFVAQSSKSHEIYLRDWAARLQVPILSVDYSLAPAAPFPRALEDVFYAYNWAVKNCQLLGSTGERVAMAGDSAGANLCMGAALKCIEHGVRPPDGLFLAYAPMVVEFQPSPARLLCLMDPLLPFGFMMRCLKAYACPEPGPAGRSADSPNGARSSDTESFEEVSESDLLELQAHKSPISETSDTLTNVSLSSQPSDASRTEPRDAQHAHDAHQYVSEFLDRYVLDSDTDSDGARVPVLRADPAPGAGPAAASAAAAAAEDEPRAGPTFQQRLAGFVAAITARFAGWRRGGGPSSAQLFLDSDRQRSVSEEFKFCVPRDPYLSPYWADEAVLRRPCVRRAWIWTRASTTASCSPRSSSASATTCTWTSWTGCRTAS